jgi:MFS family permease
MFSALKTRDYRLLFSGQAISHIGDQFQLIALPWLVLTLTHDPLQLGLVLAVAGVPRAVLMLVGGAWADRHSPRKIMLISDALRFGVTALLATAILTGHAQMWMVYVLAAAFGIVGGFFMPAAEATLPRLLENDQLESGNTLMMGTNQLASFLGPVAAGVLIAAFGTASGAGSDQAASLVGIGAAFAFDALSFLASAACLAFMCRLPALNSNPDTHPLADVAAGLRYAWKSERIRWMVLILALANLLIAGPMFVGVPVLAQTRLAGGAAALGIIFSAYGLGSLAGMLGAAGLPRLSDRLFGWLVFALMIGFSATMGLLAFVSATWIVAAIMVVAGLGNGYAAIVLITSLQRMTAEEYLGRVMSLIMLAMVGLMPISQAIAGAVIRISPEVLFVGSAAGFLIVAALVMAKRSIFTVEGEHLSPAEEIALAPAV